MRLLKTILENKEPSKFPGFSGNIESDTISNTYYRRVLYTSNNNQLVLMSLLPGEEIGIETHPDIDQFIRIETGTGKAILDGVSKPLKDGSAIIIPQGTKHNIINTSKTDDLKLYTIYSPPHHKKDAVFKTKKEADKSKEQFDGTSDTN